MDFLYDTHVWYLISFIMFAGIVYKFGKPVLLDFIDARIEAIREEIQKAENLRVEAQELLAQYQRKHRDAVKEAEGIIANAQKHAEEIRRKAEADLDETLARREKQLQDRLERLKANAIDDIQRHTASLAIEATAEIIAEKLDKAANQSLVEQSIANVSQKLH
ncbi:MAG: hypothetical protein ACPGRX_04150 [Bdellovibrionales bacterium]